MESSNIPLAIHGNVWANGRMEEQQIAGKLSLEELGACSTAKLRSLFKHIVGYAPSPRASRDFLNGNLAWVIQAQQRKKNPAVLRDQLMKRSNPAKRNLKEQYRPGTRLVREWHGVTYEVTITEQGYRWQEKHYRSLTAIAQEITGAGWSGPRFFGLTGSKK